LAPSYSFSPKNSESIIPFFEEKIKKNSANNRKLQHLCKKWPLTGNKELNSHTLLYRNVIKLPPVLFHPTFSD
jgi:hypothetical protein